MYREAEPAISNNSLQMGQGNENKACAAGTFRVWGFASTLCPSSSLGATLKLLLVCLGPDFTWRACERYVKGRPAGSRCAAFSFQLLPEEHIFCLALRHFAFSEVCLYNLFSKNGGRGVTIKGVRNHSHDSELFCFSNLLLIVE